MKMIKSKVLILCSSVFFISLPNLASAQSSLFSKNESAQKQWVGQ
ncbi:MAG: peroxiredoxin, partial [Acinetobacter sp.]